MNAEQIDELRLSYHAIFFEGNGGGTRKPLDETAVKANEQR